MVLLNNFMNQVSIYSETCPDIEEDKDRISYWLGNLLALQNILFGKSS